VIGKRGVPRQVVATDVLAFNQTENRSRRRQRMAVWLDKRFDLGAEVREICDPLAIRVAATPNPLGFRVAVGELAAAVHEAVGVIVGWIAEEDGKALTAHLEDPAKRRFAIAKVVELAKRPGPLDLSEAALLSGGWSAELVAMAAPVGPQLADLLGRSWRPDAPELRGRDSRSDKLVVLLRETVDRAALTLGRRLDWVEAQPVAQPVEDASARAQLAALGVFVGE
jgi:hypothetical protein